MIALALSDPTEGLRLWLTIVSHAACLTWHAMWLTICCPTGREQRGRNSKLDIRLPCNCTGIWWFQMEVRACLSKATMWALQSYTISSDPGSTGDEPYQATKTLRNSCGLEGIRLTHLLPCGCHQDTTRWRFQLWRHLPGALRKSLCLTLRSTEVAKRKWCKMQLKAECLMLHI